MRGNTGEGTVLALGRRGHAGGACGSGQPDGRRSSSADAAAPSSFAASQLAPPPDTASWLASCLPSPPALPMPTYDVPAPLSLVDCNLAAIEGPGLAPPGPPSPPRACEGNSRHAQGAPHPPVCHQLPG